VLFRSGGVFETETNIVDKPFKLVLNETFV
jgi:hypothetical protein